MYISRFLLIATLTVTCMFSGCSLHRPLVPGSLPATDIELTNTPFFAQEENQCGPAALASLLISSDVVTMPELLTPELFIPERKGSLQLEIVGTIRRYNRVPYQIKPDIGSITAELQAGRPILVLQNLGLKILPVYHYAVIVGMLTDGRVILRSGTTERRFMDAGDFLTSWKKTGSWGIIALHPDELPADQDIGRYLEAAAKIEATGNVKLAEQAYTTVLYQHPYNNTAIFGLANTLYAQHQFNTAASFYQYLLKQDPFHAAAANNLAEALAGLHCYKQAIELLDSFL